MVHTVQLSSLATAIPWDETTTNPTEVNTIESLPKQYEMYTVLTPLLDHNNSIRL